MLNLGALAFTAPWVLIALLALPLLWWLLRATPPSPKRVRFPAIKLLLGLAKEEETPAHTPWWLLLLRLAVAASVILALADPLWNAAARIAGNGPLLVVVDNGWAAAPDWTERTGRVAGLIDQARRTDRPVAIAGTAPALDAPALAPVSPGDADAALGALEPQPFQPDRAALLARLQTSALADTEPQIVWISDGLDHGAAADFAAGLSEIADGNVTLVEPAPGDTALALLPPSAAGGNLEITLRRAHAAGADSGTVRAFAEDGRSLGQTSFAFEPDTLEAVARFDLPLELRNRVTRIEIEGETSAGAVVLIDERWRRRAVGLVSGGSLEEDQPLLSDLYYLERALAPYAELRQPADAGTGEIEDVLGQAVSILVLTDVGQVAEPDRERLNGWVEAGGVLVRFAGPRLARQSDGLVPVRLRTGDRALGGALSWTDPQGLSAFEPGSPFFGLPVPDDVTVARQVLAEPTSALAERTWARLADGTPLVTAAPKGNGWIVLFHVTANTDWSNLPLSGLFVEMMRKLIALAQNVGGGPSQDGSRETADAGRPLAPLKTLDGLGRLGPPPVTALPVAAADLANAAPGVRHPPGFYGEAGSARALNLTGENTELTPLSSLPGIAARQGFAGGAEIALKPWLLAAAVALFLVDCLATLFVMGYLPPRTQLGRSPGRAALSTAVMLAGTVALSTADPARADEAADAFALKATSDTRLAYVVTGDAQTDELSQAGLSGLSNLLRLRTAAEPGEPIGVNVERDELAFFPLLYWPIEPSQSELSPEALARVNAYMKRGGTILFDTRDQDRSLDGLTSPSGEALRRLLTKLDIPPLMPVPEDHVLTKAFYLLQTFPGRWDGGRIWVEAPARADSGSEATATSHDGVSSIVIGSNDFAGAWARDEAGRPLLPTVPGGERQRELASRFGINLVMYALTGNYKADQVHVPALLERLGQ